MAVQPAIQPEVSTPPHRRLFTVDEYYRMGDIGIIEPEERTELIEGVIYQMAPIGNHHSYIVNKLNEIFVRQYAHLAQVSPQNPVRFNNRSEPQPDLVLVKRNDPKYSKQHPAPEDVMLIVEVSGSSLTFDHKTKLPLYAKAGIPELWIVDIEKQKVEKYTDPYSTQYRGKVVYSSNDKISINAFSDIAIHLNGIFPISDSR